MQGLNCKVTIYARVQAADDVVGGSVRTDSVRYSEIRARVSNARPASLLMQQGFEVKRMIEVIIYPDKYPGIEEEDILVPTGGQWHGRRFRIRAVQPSSLPPGHPRSHVQLFAERLDFAGQEEPEVSGDYNYEYSEEFA